MFTVTIAPRKNFSGTCIDVDFGILFRTTKRNIHEKMQLSPNCFEVRCINFLDYIIRFHNKNECHIKL